MNHDSRGLDVLLRRRDPEQFALVLATTDDVADDQIVLGDLEGNLVPSLRCRETKELGCLFHSLSVEADSRMEGIVRDEVLRYVLVEDAPVARAVLVDCLDIAPDRLLFSSSSDIWFLPFPPALWALSVSCVSCQGVFPSSERACLEDRRAS